jgi:hypothetical protein
VLAQFGRRPKDAVRPLILALEDDDPNQRAAAAVTLGNIGQDARQAVPALKKALNDPKVRVRLSAAGALLLVDEKSHNEADKTFAQMLAEMEKRASALQGLIQARLARQASLMQALAEPVLQSYCNEVVGTFIIAIAAHPPRPCGEQLTAFQQQAQCLMQNLGPEAVPCLVQGVNLITSTRLGFI